MSVIRRIGGTLFIVFGVFVAGGSMYEFFKFLAIYGAYKLLGGVVGWLELSAVMIYFGIKMVRTKQYAGRNDR